MPLVNLKSWEEERMKFALTKNYQNKAELPFSFEIKILTAHWMMH
jgi:hypothetical protein